MRKHEVRVANLSWHWSTTEIEVAYEQNGIGATSEERRRMARELWDIIATGLKDALASAPEILFVAAGGNQNSSNDFVQVVPANLRLPNLLLVGAVDYAGEETGFTSYGSSVIVHANGYEVPGLVPGGKMLPMSGTSMAAPGVANLAAKLLTVAPNMTPQQVIDVIRRTAERSSDGRRNLIHPKNALAAVELAGEPAGAGGRLN
jgi:subtilisin family serine protease